MYEIYTKAGRWYQTEDLSDALESMRQAAKAFGERPWLVGPNGLIPVYDVGTRINPAFSLTEPKLHA